MQPIKLYILCTLAMSAFAGNSLLNRYALAGEEIGAWSFTLIRLLAGAITLAVLTGFRINGGSWRGAAALLVYAAGFSFAYLALGAGIGALILFAMVQFTMLGAGVMAKERLNARQWSGVALAFGAMIWLLWPTDSAASQAPFSLWAVLFMAAAGMGWGVYSLIGRGAVNPLLATSGNFAKAALIAIILSLPVLMIVPESVPSATGLYTAMASGALTSGLGYAIWYAILPQLSRMQAGIMQLCVPALAGIGGAVLLAEIISLTTIMATALILSGIAIATLSARS